MAVFLVFLRFTRHNSVFWETLEVRRLFYDLRVKNYSLRAVDSSERAGDDEKDHKGFLREHVRLYPKFVRQWGVSGCQRSSRWVLLVMNSRRMGW